MATGASSNFQFVETRLDELASFRPGEKPCFAGGKLEPGTSSRFARTGANLLSLAGSYVGYKDQWNRSIEELTPFVSSLTRFFNPTELNSLSKIDCARIAYKTSAAIKGLQILKSSYQDPIKLRLIDDALSELNKCSVAITTASQKLDAATRSDARALVYEVVADAERIAVIRETKVATTAQVFKTMDSTDRIKIMNLKEENRKLRRENQALKQVLAKPEAPRSPNERRGTI
jgi:hypothetical protein